jgi:acyl-coenzyme A thioesterase PaaI-like protein
MTGPEITVAASDMCFGCGKQNPCGLKLEFTWDGKVAKSEFTPTEIHQGWKGIIHGGILTSLLDEAMAYAAYYENAGGVTAAMETRFKHPVLIGQPLIITAWVSNKTRRFADTEATLTLEDGTTVTTAKATQYLSSEIILPSDRAMGEELPTDMAMGEELTADD